MKLGIASFDGTLPCDWVKDQVKVNVTVDKNI